MLGTREIIRQRTQRQMAPPQAGACLLCLTAIFSCIRRVPSSQTFSEIHEGDIAQ